VGAGQITGTGVLVVNGVMDLTTSGFKDLRGRTLTSEWRTRLGDTGIFGMALGAVFNNTGRFEALSEADIKTLSGATRRFSMRGRSSKPEPGPRRRSPG